MKAYQIIKHYYVWEYAKVEIEDDEDIGDVDQSDLEFKELERDYLETQYERI